MKNLEEKYLSRNQLSVRWGVAVRTIREWDQKGTNPLTVYKIGPSINSKVRYSLSEVLKVEEKSVWKKSGS